MDTKRRLDTDGVADQDTELRRAAGAAIYNTSKFTLRDLAGPSTPQRLSEDFNDYLDGFPPDFRGFPDHFRPDVRRLIESGALRRLIDGLLSLDFDWGAGPPPGLNPGTEPRHVDGPDFGAVFDGVIRHQACVQRFLRQAEEHARRYAAAEWERVERLVERSMVVIGQAVTRVPCAARRSWQHRSR